MVGLGPWRGAQGEGGQWTAILVLVESVLTEHVGARVLPRRTLIARSVPRGATDYPTPAARHERAFLVGV